MGGRFIFGIVNFRAKEIRGSIYRGVIFWGIYIRCQGYKVARLWGWVGCGGCAVGWVGGLVKIRAKDQRKGRNEYKGINKGYKVGVKCGLSVGEIKATLGKSYFEGVNIVCPK